MPLDPSLAVGDDVVLEGIGLAKITHIEAAKIDVAMADGTKRSVFSRLERVRRPIAPEVAREALAELEDPRRSWMNGKRRFERIGDFARTEPKTRQLCHDELLRLYGTSEPLTFSERSLVARLEGVVLGELALVLGRAYDELVAQVRPAAVAAQLRANDEERS